MVQDSGLGIPPEDYPYLFEPFHRGKNVSNIPGTGLGLSTRTIEAYLSVLRLLDEYRRKHGLAPLLRSLPKVEHGEKMVRRMASRTEVTKLYVNHH